MNNIQNKKIRHKEDIYLAKEKIEKAKIQLRNYPFFHYLLQSLTEFPIYEFPTVGVDRTGILFYNPNFINSISVNFLKTVLCHEVLHVAFFHERANFLKSEQDRLIFNIATDICVNYSLLKDGFEFEDSDLFKRENFILPNIYNFSYELPNGNCITEINKKNCYQIYKELKNNWDNKCNNIINLDEHDISKYVDSLKKSLTDLENGTSSIKEIVKDLSEDEKNLLENNMEQLNDNKWEDKISEAVCYEQMNPGNSHNTILDLYYTKNVESLSWRNLLEKFMIKQIPFDESFENPKEYESFLLPNVERENIEFIILLDTSASVEKDMFSRFIGHVKKMINSFNKVEAFVLPIDTKVQNFVSLNKFEKSKIKFKGRGGTNFDEAFKFLKRKGKQRNIPILIFTDGEVEKPNYQGFKNNYWCVIKDKKLKMFRKYENI